MEEVTSHTELKIVQFEPWLEPARLGPISTNFYCNNYNIGWRFSNESLYCLSSLPENTLVTCRQLHNYLSTSLLKVSRFRNVFLVSSFGPKKQRIIFQDSTIASKKRSNQKGSVRENPPISGKKCQSSNTTLLKGAYLKVLMYFGPNDDNKRTV